MVAKVVAVGVAVAGALETGVNTGVEAVHWGQIVTVSVVKKVEYMVTTSMDVLPFLVWVVVDAGQLVTVV